MLKGFTMAYLMTNECTIISGGSFHLKVGRLKAVQCWPPYVYGVGGWGLAVVLPSINITLASTFHTNHKCGL